MIGLQEKLEKLWFLKIIIENFIIFPEKAAVAVGVFEDRGRAFILII